MTDETIVHKTTASTSSFSIFRPDKSQVTISGALRADVVAGALLLRDQNDNAQFIFGPGQWVTVNIAPT